MSANLITRIREQRRLKVQAGGHTFFARRPTDVEAVELHRSGATLHEIARRFVAGWEGVTEDHVVGGGGSDPVPFSAELWTEWCADRPDLWEPIASAVLDAYQLHAQRLEQAGKN